MLRIDGSKKNGSSCICILLGIAISENRKSPKTFFWYVVANFKFTGYRIYIIHGSVAHAIAHIRAIGPEKILCRNQNCDGENLTIAAIIFNQREYVVPVRTQTMDDLWYPGQVPIIKPQRIMTGQIIHPWVKIVSWKVRYYSPSMIPDWQRPLSMIQLNLFVQSCHDWTNSHLPMYWNIMIKPLISL